MPDTLLAEAFLWFLLIFCTGIVFLVIGRIAKTHRDRHKAEVFVGAGTLLVYAGAIPMIIIACILWSSDSRILLV